MLFFIILADGIMSYQVPVLMDRTLHSATLMGVILATSSMAGMVVDFLFAKSFGNKRSAFFTKIVLSSAFLFPISLLIYLTIPSFIFAMLVWGVYYEGIVFSNYHAVHEYMHPSEHLWGWGVLSIVKNLGWVIGPLLASMLDGVNQMHPVYFALGFYLFGSALFGLRAIVAKRFKHLRPIVPVTPDDEVSHPFKIELKIWRVYAKVLWPMLIGMFVFFLIDSTFFSIGPVFGEEVAKLHPYGGLFISMYTVPTVICAFLGTFMAKRWGKKRSAFLSGIWAGVWLLVMSVVGFNPLLILSTTWIASVGLAVFYPSLTAVFEDYVARSGKLGNDIVGMTAIMGSFGYVVGPMLNGFLADTIGAQHVFGVWGVVLLVSSLFSLVYVKRKIRLPQQAAEAVLALSPTQ